MDRAILALLFSITTPPGAEPVRVSESVPDGFDAVAIWVNREDPESSWILATSGATSSNGALVALGLDGRIRESMVGLDRPAGLDVEYGFDGLDIVAVAERGRNRLVLFSIGASGLEVAGAVDCGESPGAVALYKRPVDGAVFAITASGSGLQQFRLIRDGEGQVFGVRVRQAGEDRGPFAALAVDDTRGLIYAGGMNRIHRYRADPAHPRASREVRFGEGGVDALAVVRSESVRGFLLAAQDSGIRAYRREGANRDLFSLPGGAVTGATGEYLGPGFPQGIFVTRSPGAGNFLLYRWQDIMRR